MRQLLAIIIMLLVLNHYAEACQFDTDCNVGNICLKADTQVYGICVGDKPGNSFDKQPVQTHNPHDSYGQTCHTRYDCGSIRECVKGNPGLLTGVCM